ncbi:glutamate ABC transporter substrate-binding protein [Nonomuraea sp. NPDC050328]|uniref:glutamate ABC transporter substrate-binding protein n=1 Tax=Nonomuraea sp. NPDC050328 TaxID=3364361 RepID=UPI00378ACF16
MRRRGRTSGSLALRGMVAAALGAAPVGCDAATGSILDRDELVVAVKADQPGLGLKTGSGGFEGFEVDVARYIADYLGKRVSFVATTSEGREDKLRDGSADLVIATYSISPPRKEQVTFAGPYYVARQDILVRRGITAIRDVRDLAGRRLCQASGSISTARIVEARGIAAVLVPAKTYGECVELLRRGEVEAVSTGDLILAGYAARDRDAFTILNAPFTEERYGVALPLGDVAGCEEINRALTAMYQSGAVKTMLQRRFGASGLDLTRLVPQFEGCE